MKHTPNEVEQIIANELFISHGLVLDTHGYINGVNVGLEFVETRTGGSSWGYGYKTGKTQIRVGPRFGDVRSVGFKERKDGTHSYDKIADKLELFYRKILAKRTQDNTTTAQYNVNKAGTKEMLKRLGVSEYTSALDVNYKFGTIKFQAGGITIEQAEALMLKAIELGIVKTNS